MKKCINWERIIAIGGLTLCTTLVATGCETTTSIINAALVAGVALFTELKFESEPIIKAQRALSASLII